MPSPQINTDLPLIVPFTLDIRGGKPTRPTTKRLDREIAHDVRAATAERTTYVITVRNASNAGLPAPETATGEGHPNAGAASDQESADRAAADDLVPNESLVILRDYAELLQAKALAN
jgi:hypothetical protein